MCRVSAVCSISLLLLHDANSNTAVIKRCFFMDRFFYDKRRKTKGKSLKGIESIECFAYASQTTSPQDYKTTSGCRMMLRYRFADYKSTRLQDYKTATASLVVSLTSCLVVWRSNAKLNFRNSIIPATALLVVSLSCNLA